MPAAKALTPDQQIDALHRPLSEMIVAMNAYVKMPASGYEGRRFIVILEPMLSPRETNARIYGLDYVVVASPAAGRIRIAAGGGVTQQSAARLLDAVPIDLHASLRKHAAASEHAADPLWSADQQPVLDPADVRAMAGLLAQKNHQ